MPFPPKASGGSSRPQRHGRPDSITPDLRKGLPGIRRGRIIVLSEMRGDMDDSTQVSELDRVEGSIRATLERAIKSHRGWGDSVWHNGGTIVAIAATTVATVLPANYSIWARTAAGVATFFIAVSRALDFGTRWRWHLDMRARYSILLDRLDQVAVIPLAERAAILAKIYDDLARVRTQELAIPGAGLNGSNF